MMTTCIARGSARQEVHAIDLRIKKGQRRPSRTKILGAISHLVTDLGAEAYAILSQERLGYDEHQVVVVLFWRTDESAS